ncbi:hypothetical protein [Streptomyces zagrosensis]|uniref:Uncharacterized protein n=1 Tax=Streptomyces zagrosensis TaxID=1042984 RepID=A0A7W9QHZ5_9ACTN|nr:hypothetical protein [Streptomyces zagrosensis]MBB5940389.1 hypothetical protein [Streptomyces zagrosensis]
MNWDREPSSPHRFTPTQEPVVPVTVRAASPPYYRTRTVHVQHTYGCIAEAYVRRLYGVRTAPAKGWTNCGEPSSRLGGNHFAVHAQLHPVRLYVRRTVRPYRSYAAVLVQAPYEHGEGAVRAPVPVRITAS